MAAKDVKFSTEARDSMLRGKIVQNAGEDGSLVVGKLLENDSHNWGFNAATGEYQDLVKAGVIDPAKVV